jgi:hypothetical protein
LAESNDFEEQVGEETAAVAGTAIEEALVVSSAQIAGLGPSSGLFDETLLAILNGDVDAPSALTELQRQVDAQ